MTNVAGASGLGAAAGSDGGGTVAGVFFGSVGGMWGDGLGEGGGGAGDGGLVEFNCHCISLLRARSLLI